MFIVQKLKKQITDEFDLAQKYYSVLSDVNNLQLAKKEIELIAFTAIKGNITEKANKLEFCVKYNSSIATINNMVWKLKKPENNRIFVKVNKKTVVNPAIVLDFNTNVILQITLEHGN
jgi:hypothetical protein